VAAGVRSAGSQWARQTFEIVGYRLRGRCGIDCDRDDAAELARKLNAPAARSLG